MTANQEFFADMYEEARVRSSYASLFIRYSTGVNNFLSVLLYKTLKPTGVYTSFYGWSHIVGVDYTGGASASLW